MEHTYKTIESLRAQHKLSVRFLNVCNGLSEHDRPIVTLRDLSSHTTAEFLRRRHCGAVTLAQGKALLAAYGLSFGMTYADDFFRITELVSRKIIAGLTCAGLAHVLKARGWTFYGPWRGGEQWCMENRKFATVPSETHADRDDRIVEAIQAISQVDNVSIWKVIGEIRRGAS